jgi:hypothetical protein
MDYLSLLDTHAAPISDTDVAKLEALIEAPLPESYVEYLRQSNGGTFRINTVDLPQLGDETVLNYMFTTIDPSYDIVEQYRMLRGMDRIPVQSLPIADDPGGNKFLISLEPATYGQVFFWDHENEPEDGGARVADFPNMTHLADDFATFIANLKPDETGS